VEVGDGIGKVTLGVEAGGVVPARRAAVGDKRAGAAIEIGTDGEVCGGGRKKRNGGVRQGNSSLKLLALRFQS
jgi:hypothetical protein